MLKKAVASELVPGPTDPVHEEIKLWNEDYEENGVTKTRKVWQCVHCGLKKVFSNPGRVRNHLTGEDQFCKKNGGVPKCSKAPEHVKQKFYKLVNEAATKKEVDAAKNLARQRLLEQERVGDGAAVIDLVSETHVVKRTKLEDTAIGRAFGKGTSEAADAAVANFFHGETQIPASVLQSPFWSDMVAAIKKAPSSWKAPDRHRIYGPMLEKKVVDVTRQVQLAYTRDVFGKSVSTDGATVHGQPLINVVVQPATQQRPFCLGVKNCTKQLFEKGKKGALFYAENAIKMIRELPDKGHSITLLITDTPADMQKVWSHVSNICEQMLVHPCTSHCANIILKKVCALRAIEEIVEWNKVISETFSHQHLPRTLLTVATNSHFGRQLMPLRPCDSRYGAYPLLLSLDFRLRAGLNVFLCIRNLRLLPALQSAVTSEQWTRTLDKKTAFHPVKDLVLDQERWKKAVRLLRLVYPVAMICKLGDFAKPALSKLYHQQLECERLWEREKESTDEEVSELASNLLKIIETDIGEDGSDDDDVAEYDELERDEMLTSTNRWQLQKSDAALAAYAMDPQFHNDKPWSDPIVSAAFRRVVDKRLGFNEETEEYDDDLLCSRRVEFDEQWGQYVNSMGIFSKPYVWSAATNGKTLACVWWQNNGVEVPRVQSVAMGIMSLCCGSGAAERNWKDYKETCTKKRNRMGHTKSQSLASLLEESDVDLDKEEQATETTATKLTFVKSNLHCAKFNDYVLSDAEQQLRSFDASDSKAFEKITLEFNPSPVETDARPHFRNFVEYWENPKTQTDDMTAWFRNKYIGMKLVDTDEDGEQEKRIINDVTFHTRRPKGYRLIAGLLKRNGHLDRSTEAAQDYQIDDDLHELIMADLNESFAFKEQE